MGGRSSPDGDDYCEGDEGGSGGDSRGGAGRGSADPFMCTPQSFPPTPISRANVMARTSQFADDILFLARDQLRLGENLKPGVDETVRECLVCGVARCFYLVLFVSIAAVPWVVYLFAHTFVGYLAVQCQHLSVIWDRYM